LSEKATPGWEGILASDKELISKVYGELLQFTNSSKNPQITQLNMVKRLE
jgi:hypothetical protein